MSPCTCLATRIIQKITRFSKVQLNKLKLIILTQPYN